MHVQVILRILGILLMFFSLTMVVPTLLAIVYDESSRHAFTTAFLVILIGGLIIWAPVKNVRGELRTRDGFVITALFWFVLGGAGALPLFLTKPLDMTIVDAVFESISGLTTTGATVIVGLDDLPRSVLFYRQQLQWLGGMGIIVLAVAILPMLGIGGMQLYRAETPGPIKDSKLTPRITETAKALWYIYAALTAACCLAYWAAGMSFFDAICHSFSTVAIGGFSTYDASIGHFNSPVIEAICILFMLISGVNFGLHFFVWRKLRFGQYFKDPEFRFYLGLLGSITVIACSMLIYHGTYPPLQALRTGVFEVVSIATTTGFATADGYANWPTVLPFMLFVAAFAGGCAGSTGGGMKVIRILLLTKQGIREVKRLIHPNGVFPIKVGTHAVSDRVVEAVWGFFSIYILVFVFMLMALMATGIDQVTAWTAVGATLNNLGPGLGDVANHYADLNSTAKWVLCLSMLLGRLEVFTLIVILSPMFWRK